VVLHHTPQYNCLPCGPGRGLRASKEST